MILIISIIGLSDEGNTRYLKFEIDTSFDPEVSEFSISVDGENQNQLFYGRRQERNEALG